MIELRNISKYYNNNGVVNLGLRNINLSFDKNEIVAITGESGSGKSTLLNVICGVDSYEEGEILFNGYETSYFNQEDMDTFRRLNVSFIYQNYNIIDSYTVLENVMFPLLINGFSKKEAKERALELIEKVGLSHRVYNRGVKLSGGEKQRCVIARALATDAPILACDEPTGNLDSKTGEDIINLIKEVSKDKLVLIVTHNYEQVEGIVTRTIKMADGEVVSDSNVNNNVIEDAKDGDIFTEDVKKIKYKTIASIGLNNLKSTPKKNIFIFLVLLVLSFIGVVLFGNAYYSSREAQYNSYSGFNNLLRDRIIVYDQNHKSFDSSLFNGYEAYVNAFYEDDTFNLKLDSREAYFYEYVCLTEHMPSNISDIKGTKGELGENQGFLVLPSSYYYDGYVINQILEQDLDLFIKYPKSEKIDIVGVGVSGEVERAILVLPHNTIKNYSLYNSFGGSVKVNDEKIYLDTIFNKDLTKPSLTLAFSDGTLFTDFKVSSKMYEFNIDKNDCDIKYGSENKLELPTEYLKKDCYELTIYSNDLKKVERIASDNNLKTIIPAKSGTTIFSFSFIEFIFAIAYSVLIMIFLVFISYVVLQKVYQSRRKDYAIMRSLGMMRPQMAKIIRFEVISLGMVASLISIVIVIVFGAVTKIAQLAVIQALSPVFFIMYLVLMFLFDLRLANKFNKKLFKFSVTKTIKEVF